MRRLILVPMAVLALGSLGCEDSSAPRPSFPDQFPNPGGSLVSIDVKSGRDFECFTHGGDMWCHGVNPTVGINSVGYSLVVESDSDITSFEVWDDTVCFTATVDTRPYNGDGGVATYCIGEASLGFNYSGYPMVYSPPFVTATHGSSDISWSLEPFVGYDGSIGVFTNEGGNWLVMQDGDSLTSESSEDCEVTATELVCDGFSVAL